MPKCMARGLVSSPSTPICGAPSSSHSILTPRSFNGRAWLAPRLDGKKGPCSCSPLTNVGKWPSSSPALHHVRKNGLAVVRSEKPGSELFTTTTAAEKTEADKLVDGMTFGELCDEFECITSPAVEGAARLIVRDILELREENRGLATYAIFVKYRDPLRSFKGREKFKRPSWVRATLDNPSVAVQEMSMASRSVLNIRWILRGKPKLPPASVVGGELVLATTSVFTLNQISGQVIEQVEKWDLSQSSVPAVAYFWATRLSYSAVEAGKDLSEAIQGVTKALDRGKDDNQDDNQSNIYPDPSGDPRKFFQVDNNPQNDIYQVGLVIALLYLLVQFLKLVI